MKICQNEKEKLGLQIGVEIEINRRNQAKKENKRKYISEEEMWKAWDE